MMSRTTRLRRSSVLMSSSLPTVVTSSDFSLSLRIKPQFLLAVGEFLAAAQVDVEQAFSG